MDKFSNDALAYHNFLRFKHNAPALTFSAALQRSAQAWAEQLLTRSNLETSPAAKHAEVGENLCRKRGATGLEGTGGSASPSASISAREVVEYWYADASKFNFKDGTGEAGAFSQLVWKRTREVGFGVARSADQCVVVAHYSPPGNVVGLYLANVEHASEVLETMKGKKKVEESLTFLSPTGEVTVKKSEKEYVDIRGNFVRSTKHVLLKNGTGATSGGAAAAKGSDSHAHSHTHKPTADKDTKHSKPLKEDSDTSSDEDVNSKKDLTTFRKDVLEQHNKCRKTHGAPELKANKDLDILAQRWARKLSKMDKLVNSLDRYKNDALGENIAARRSNVTCDYTAKEVVEHWYESHTKYDFRVEPAAIENVGNFTQLVWKGSKEVGIGKHVHRDANGSKAVVVCYYYPAGNIKTLFRENVLSKK